jgi:hypothetical protein
MYSRCRHRYTFIYFYRQVLVALIVACVLLRFAEKARRGCDSMGGVASAIQGPNRVVKHTCFFSFTEKHHSILELGLGEVGFLPGLSGKPWQFSSEKLLPRVSFEGLEPERWEPSYKDVFFHVSSTDIWPDHAQLIAG